MNAGEWIGRVALLLLSALATFAILASIETASQFTTGTRPTAGSSAMPDATEPTGVAQRRASPGAEGAERAGGRTPAPDAGATIGSATATAADETREIARWLKALTYAVLGLAGFAAVAVVLLLRIGSHLARIADRG